MEQPDSLLTQEDVKSIVRLLGRIACMEADVPTRKRALVDGLAQMVGATQWLWSITRDARDGGTLVSVGYLHGGMSPQQVSAFLGSAVDAVDPQPERDAMLKLINATPRQHFTRSRQQMVTDEVWYSSKHVLNWFKPVDMNHTIYSIYPLEENHTLSGLAMYKPWNSPPFTDRELRIIHLVFAGIAELHYAGMPGEEAKRIDFLTPRQKEVMMLLMDGHGRKQIANLLGISQYTVADHTKKIYEHFNATSRSELFKHFMTGHAHKTTE